MIIIAEQMLELIQGLGKNAKLDQLARYCEIIIAQLRFIESFTEDLLNINMIQEGVFKLDPIIFDPKEAISFITEMFSRKAKMKQIKIEFQQLKKLQDPENN